MNQKEINEHLTRVRRVADAWKVYSDCVLPADADPIQRSEICQSFYAGADWILQRVIVSSHVEEDEGESLIAELLQEFDEWKQAVKEGRV